jgi:GMP synthase PP-ATPase subunit
MLVRRCERAIAQLRAQIGKGKVIYGLLRKDEGEQVAGLVRGHDNIPLVHADASSSSSTRSPARPTPGRAQDDRRAVPGAGHALS